MKREICWEPARAEDVPAVETVEFRVSSPDEQGNRFITALGGDESPVPANKSGLFEREGA